MIKYIIAVKNGKLYHKKSDCQHHLTLIKDNNLNWQDVLEIGVIIDKKVFALEIFKSEKHKQKAEKIGKLIRYDLVNALRGADSKDMEKTLKARQVESLYSYGYIKQGD